MTEVTDWQGNKKRMQAECENSVEHLKAAGTQGPKVCAAQVGLVAALRRRLATSGSQAGGEPPYVGESR